MSITLSYEPVGAQVQAAVQAGLNEQQNIYDQKAFQLDTMALQHDLQIRTMEKAAEIEANARFREHQFQQATQGEQFIQGRLSLQEQYGYNIQLARAKAQIDQQNETQNYQQYLAGTKAIQQSVADGIASPEQAKLAQVALADRYGYKNVASMVAGPKMNAQQGLIAAGLREQGIEPTAEAIFQAEQEQKVQQAEARGKGYALYSNVTAWDRNTGKTFTTNKVDFQKMLEAEPDRYVEASKSPEFASQMKAVAQRYGTRSANVQTAYKVYMDEVPKLIDLRQRVAMKGLLPASSLKDINRINQWLSMASSDPDTAELKKRTTLLADNLQRTIGGTSGGQWAFNVASTLLDPTLAPEAFTRVMNAHGQQIGEMARAYQSFGEEAFNASPEQSQSGQYEIGQIIKANGKKYKITGLSNPSDPDVEEVK